MARLYGRLRFQSLPFERESIAKGGDTSMDAAMTSDAHTPAKRDAALWGIFVVLAIYALSLTVGLPQRWTAAVIAGHATGAQHGVAAPAAERSTATEQHSDEP